MARIVITEPMDERAVARLREHHEVCYGPGLIDDEAAMLRESADCDALIVRNRTQVRGVLLDGMPRCRVVGRLGVGLDNLDMQACAARGIQVFPAWGANALSVAEYVITCTLMLLRGVYADTAEVAAGRWPRARLGLGREAAGKTMGIIGFGAIGQTSARLARALGLSVIAHDAALPVGHDVFAAQGVTGASLADVLAQADVLTLHVPLVDGTRGLLNAARIAAMKPQAVLINTARGPIVELSAVVAALRSGHLGGAAIDVFDIEPMPGEAMLQDCPNLLLTPHISGQSRESNERVSFMVAGKVLEALG
jgi:(S)-sulfolactate dehydrogenase